jgi:hypothetical protein
MGGEQWQSSLTFLEVAYLLNSICFLFGKIAFRGRFGLVWLRIMQLFVRLLLLLGLGFG